ncbi:fibronectin type III domain-containing protein [Pelotomaculum isophthalicicum JI]|uniref:Fibronectin type III domain-containing protein n=1 Tax=Pelotomaculum isophthalicicum JI TaxID=947010 RepID=A0A9X4GZP2_9FIRM|nr:fibronectin type III domain-containing protein [Pelotomaculum isophthalicicum]MDF9409007.1 fibronectin type III domain-containing protein [Pelotomaculum isophthalicicum JI]
MSNKTWRILLTVTFIMAMLFSVGMAAHADESTVVTIGNVVGGPGTEIQVPVYLNSTGNVAVGQFDMYYDSALLTYTGYSRGDLVASTSHSFIVSNPSTGPKRTRVIISSNPKAAIPAGSGTLIILRYQVAAGAQPGQSCALQLINNPPTSTLKLNDVNNAVIPTTWYDGQFSVPGGGSITLSVDPAAVTLNVGATRAITATVDPNDATLSYSSSNEAVAAVDTTGTITALSPGDADITVTASKAGYTTATATVAVTVNAPADTEAPAWPEGSILTAAASGGSVDLSWPAATDNVGVTGYQVYQNSALVDTVSGATRNYNVTGLIPGSYTFSVKAVDAATNTSAALDANASVALATDKTLQIFGTGVNHDVNINATDWAGFTLQDRYYSSNNSYNFHKIVKTRGYSLWDVIGTDNLKTDQDYDVTFIASDGFKTVRKVSQLNGYFYYPDLYTEASKVTVGPMLDFYKAELVSVQANPLTGPVIWSDRELAAGDADSGAVRVVFGQANASDKNESRWAKYVVKILVGQDAVAPAWPEGSALTAAASGTSVALSWPAATDDVGVTGYNVYQGETLLTETPITTTSYNVTGLAPGSSYTFSVKAVDAAGNASAPLTADATTALGAITLSASPASAALIAGNTQAITATVDPADASLSYVSSDTSVAAVDAGGVISAVGAGSATITVTASKAGYNDATATVQVTVNTAAETDQVAPVWPTASALTATVAADGVSVALSWTAATDNIAVTGYKVYQNGTLITTVPVTGTSYTATGLTVNTQYTFRVTAGDAAGNWTGNGPSATVITTTPTTDTSPPYWPAGSGVTASGATHFGVNLSWTAAGDNVGVTGYRIYKNGTLIDTVSGTGYSATGLSANTMYTFRITAGDAAGNWSRSGVSVTVTTP